MGETYNSNIENPTDDKTCMAIYGKKLYEMFPDKYMRNDLVYDSYKELVRKSGFNLANINDLLGKDISYIVRSKPGSSIDKSIIKNLCYYFQVDTEFLMNKSQFNRRVGIPNRADTKAYWVLNKEGLIALSSGNITDIAYSIKVPKWMLMKAKQGDTIYITSMIAEKYIKAIMKVRKMQKIDVRKYVFCNSKKIYPEHIRINSPLWRILSDKEKMIAIPDQEHEKKPETQEEKNSMSESSQQMEQNVAPETNVPVSKSNNDIKTILNDLSIEDLDRVIEYIGLLKERKEIEKKMLNLQMNF